MRSDREIRSKLSEMLLSLRRQHARECLAVAPANCRFNVRLKVKGQGYLRFCQNPAILESLKAKVLVCNDDDAARSCGLFVCRHTHASADEDFDTIVRNPSLCGEKYPKLAILIWVVQERIQVCRWRRFAGALMDLVYSVKRLFFLRWW